MFRKIGILILIFTIALLTGLVYYTYQVTAPMSGEYKTVIFKIEAGDGVSKIASALDDENLIKSDFWFKAYLKINNLAAKVLPGEYSLTNRLNIREIAAALIEADNLEIKVLFREGLTHRQTAEVLEQSGLVKGDDFLNVVGYNLSKFVGDYDFLSDKPSNVDLEGYLFPDTYYFYYDAQPEQIARKMLNNFNSKLMPGFRQEIQRQNKTIFEIITLASIIEKEVSSAADMRNVADIFYKRLEAGIALQSDATVNYITGKSHVQPSLADTQIDNPYNTYKYRGLPPGPIANPGLQAIEAAVYPSANPYYYFLTTPEGQTIYSKTYDEHLQNKYKYLK